MADGCIANIDQVLFLWAVDADCCFSWGRRQGSCGKGVAWIIGEERTTASEKERSFAFYDRDHQRFSTQCTQIHTFADLFCILRLFL